MEIALKISKRFISTGDLISAWCARCVRWLVLILMGIIVYDVVARYVFNTPTVWAFHISYMLGGTICILGAAYVFQIDRHVRIDILQRRFPQRTKLLIEMILSTVLFFPWMYFLIKFSVMRTIRSWSILEKASLGFWYPPLYPLRTLITIGLIVLFVQGLIIFIRDVYLLAKGEQL